MTRHDVIIVGAGPAGLSAARRLAELGIKDVLLLERESAAGGVPRHCGHTGFGLVEFHRPLHGPDYARRLVDLAAPAQIRTGTTVTRLLPGGEIEVVGAGGPERLAARAVLIATGARETPRSARLVGGTRPWGVTTTGALQQLVYLAGARPFDRAVIVGSELVSFSAILTLRHAGITPVAMLEENARITARRPADWIARALFRVPVLTEARLIAILGQRRVEAVEIERRGSHEQIACDGIVFTGRFVPEAALLPASPIEIDPATGGPSIDQHWRCSDPAYFAAGNLLRPIETSGTAWTEGRRAAECIAAALAGRLPAPARELRIAWAEPLRYVYPQRLSLPSAPDQKPVLRARVSRPVSGRLALLADGRELWSRRLSVLPERRIVIPADRLPLNSIHRVSLLFEEHAGSRSPQHSAIKPQSILTERSPAGTVPDNKLTGNDRAAE